MRPLLMTEKSWLTRFWDWLFTTPTPTPDALDATRLTADEPDPPQHMRDVAGVAHVRLVDIPKKPARRKAKGPVRKPRP